MSKTTKRPGRKAKHKSGPMLRLNYRERLETCEALQDLADRLGTDVSTEIRKATAQRVRTMARLHCKMRLSTIKREMRGFTRTHTHRSDPDTSREAARKVEPRYSLSCGYCLDFVEGEGTRGATYKEAVLAGLSQQRFSDLHRMDPPRIVWNGEKRDGCRVYVVAE